MPVNLRIGEDAYTLPVTFSNEELTKHILINGSTGSGKTSQLMTIIAKQISRGGGVIYVDGKSENPTWMQFYSMAKKYGREDEVFLLSFRASAEAMSSKWNFMMEGTSSEISDIILNLSIGTSAQKAGDNKVFIDRAKNLMKLVCSALTYLRDVKKEVITIQDLIQCINLNALVAMASPSVSSIPPDCIGYAKYWIPNDYIEKGMSLTSKSAIIEYLRGIGANISEEKPFNMKELAPDVRSNLVKQHSFAQMQFQEALNDLANVYGRIFNSRYSDINLSDIIANNELLYVLVPSLEKSSDAKAGIGKMVLTAIKGACSYMLGAKSEGTNEILMKDLHRRRSKPTYLMILDEYGSYITPGVEDIFAQARSLGISVIVSIQEYASLEIQGDQREKKRIKSNTNIKIALKTECEETIQDIVKAAGKRTVMLESRKDIHKTNIFKKKLSENIETKEEDRVKPEDLKKIRDGYGYILYNGEVRKYRADYINPEYANEIILPRMIPKLILNNYVYESFFSQQ